MLWRLVLAAAIASVASALPSPGALPAGELLTKAPLPGYLAAPYFEVSPISDGVIARMDGVSWRPGAMPISELRYLSLLYWGFDGGTYVGEMVVNGLIADGVLDTFTELYLSRYEIELMVLIDNFGADDTLSMNANNTSAFNHRFIAGTTTLSNHARGLAIDINPVQNPYVRGGDVQPEAGRAFVDRASGRAHMISHDDAAYRLLTERGFTWGGDWTTPRDYQHFEFTP